MTALHVASPAFEDGATIPERYGYSAANVNPPLDIEGTPPETQSLVLIVESTDPEEQANEAFTHWLVWDIPPEREELPEGWEPAEAVEGQNTYGEHGYGGPNSTNRGHAVHFRLYAVDSVLGLPSETEKATLVDAVTGNVVDRARVVGAFEP